METRAHHLLIGGFILVLLAAMLGFAAWLAKLRVDREFSYYRIYFEGSVTGLSRASDVRFNGVPVGTVSQIKVDPDDPKQVRVTIEIAADTPVRTDTYAQLEWQGLTGASFVQLIGGSGTAPMLAYERGKRPPNIPARKSTVQELVSAAPELLQKGLNIADRMMAVLGDDNQAALSSTLRNADRFATTLGEKAMTVGRALDNVDAASTAMLDAAKAINDMVARLDKVAQGTDQTLGSIRGTFGRADRVLDRDIPTLVSEFRETAKSFTRMSEDLRRLVADNREAIGDFSTSGLIEFAKFVEEARTLVSTLSRVTNRIESDPAQFLFGDAQRGYKPR